MKKLILFGSLLFTVSTVFSQKSVKLTVPKTVNELNAIIKKQPAKQKHKLLNINNDAIKKFKTVAELQAYIADNPNRININKNIGQPKKILISHPKTTNKFRSEIKNQ